MKKMGVLILSGLALACHHTQARRATTDVEKEAVRAAVLDYVEGIYEVKPERIARSVHPQLRKYGFGKRGSGEYWSGKEMTYSQLYDLAANYNKSGKIDPAKAPKVVEIFDMYDKTASAKLRADWGIDYFHLIKDDDDGRWKILNVIWQGVYGQ